MTHLDPPDERRVRVIHHDILWPEFLEYAIVFIVEIRSDDDQVFVPDEAEVLLEVERVERLLNDLVRLDVARRYRRVDAGGESPSACGPSFRPRTRTVQRSS